MIKRFLIVLFLVLFCASSWAATTTVQVSHTDSAPPSGAGVVSFGGIGTVANVQAQLSIVVPTPTHTTNSLLLLVLADDADTDITAYDGFTRLGTDPNYSEIAESSHRLTVMYLLPSTVESSYTISSNTNNKSAYIVALEKTQGTWNLPEFAVAGISSQPLDCGGVTVDQDGSMVMTFYGNDDNPGGFVDPGGTETLAGSYSADEPEIAVWYESADTGPYTGLTIQPNQGSNATCITVEVGAQ